MAARNSKSRLAATAVASAILTVSAADAMPYVFRTIDYNNAVATYVTAINNRGTIVGYYVRDPAEQTGFRYAAGQFSLVSVPGSERTRPLGINDAGTIVGSYDNPGNLPPGTSNFAYQGGRYAKIDFPADVIASDINNAGVVVGWNGRGFVADGGTVTELAVPGAAVTNPLGINNLGQIVGNTFDGRIMHGFLDDHGRFVSIDIPGAVQTSATGINDAGTIVGISAVPAGLRPSSGVKQHGFIDVDGVLTPFDVAGAAQTELFGINDFGWIVGAYYGPDPGFPGFAWHGFVAMPEAAIAEPGTLALIAGAFGMVLGGQRARRRARDR